MDSKQSLNGEEELNHQPQKKRGKVGQAQDIVVKGEMLLIVTHDGVACRYDIWLL